MIRRSAGILVYRLAPSGLEVLLAHPGGPYWAQRDEGAWSLPKGEHGEDESPETAALREFAEETGIALEGELLDLGEVRQRSGKHVHGFAMLADLDPADARSNTFEIEWPPRSGRHESFPEIDRLAWFDPATAREKLLAAQSAFVDRLEAALARGEAEGPTGP